MANEAFIIPKQFLKKKNVTFYKAYVMEDGQNMTVDTEIDIFGLTEEAALQHMLHSMSSKDALQLQGKDINFLVIAVDKSDILNKPILSNGEPIYKDGCITITLNEKMFKIDLLDRHITELSLDINDETDIKIIKHVKMH